MRVRIHDGEVAAAFMGLARLRPDVILAPAPTARVSDRRPGGGAHGVYEVGLLGSFNSDDRAGELASLVSTWKRELHGRFGEVGVEVVS